MATNYPAALDTFPNQPTLATHLLSTDTHSKLHGDIGDAIRAVETYVGTSVSPSAGTITYRLNQIVGTVGTPSSVLTPVRRATTVAYTASSGDLVVMDGFVSTITLPASPIDRTYVAVTKATATYGGTIQPAGTNTIEGANAGSAQGLDGWARQAFLLQYQAASGKWLVFSFTDYETSVSNYLAKSADQIFTGISTAPAWECTGLTGATTGSRWVGTVDGADPSSGTFSVGDYVVDRTLGGFRIYTSAGWRTVAPAGSAGAFRAITSTATLDDGDYIVAADSTSGAITVNLPTAVGLEGKEYRIKRTNSGANGVTIDPNASETVDGATTVTLSSQWDVARIVSDGANWLRF